MSIATLEKVRYDCGMRTIALALLLAVSAVPTALAKPRAGEESDKVVLSNDHVTVWFQGKKPMLKVFDTGNDSRSFKVFIKEIVELQGVGSQAEEIATLRLARAQSWNVTVDEGEENGTEAAKVTMRLSDVPRFLGSQQELLGLPPQVQERLQRDAAPANVTFTFHVYERGTHATGINDTTVNVTAYEVKWDLHVEDWPWVNEANRLAIRFQVKAPGFDNETANLTDEGEDGVAVSGNESEPIGSVTWAETAVVVDGANVNNTTVSSAAFEPGEKDANGHSFLLVFAATGYEELFYDPSFAIMPAPESVDEGGEDDDDDGIPGFEAPLLAVAAALAIALSALRRKK
jgi:hypothetical protein